MIKQLLKKPIKKKITTKEIISVNIYNFKNEFLNTNCFMTWNYFQY